MVVVVEGGGSVLTLCCHHQNEPAGKMGNGVSHLIFL